jgi:BirA family biotin operon repressor/biotin-[acetyl-CoA-carboxylase] ligase
VIPERLIALLADGRFHSGAALAAELGITRAAVWKQVGHLAGLGLDVQRVKGRGYRLAHPIELLDPARIRAALTESVRGRLGELRIAATLPSTNTALLARDGDGLDVCLAEHQSDGRGRQGRTWVSPYGAGICLSVGWTFIALPRGIQSLSLAIGVGVAERPRGSDCLSSSSSGRTTCWSGAASWAGSWSNCAANRWAGPGR